jgi:GGDEF domain-containing protein
VTFCKPLLQTLAWLSMVFWHVCGQASPQVNWGEMLAQAQSKQGPSELTIDLRTRWESTLVGSVELANDVPLDPAQVWAWPAERFSTQGNSQPLRIRASERHVARVTVFSERLASDFSLTMGMPRLDAVHVSYRLDGGAWTSLSAGDTLAMKRWPLADRQPSFNLPLPPGQMDIVLQFAHRGILDAPVLLQNNRAFLASRTNDIWVAGMLIGINLVMALMGMLMALNFQKISFLSVTVMSTMVAMVLMFGSGLGGTFLGTEGERFNDEMKFIANTIWGMILPWVAAVAIGIRAHSRLWWWSALLLGLSGLVLSYFWVDYSVRDTAPMGIMLLLMFVLLFVLAMMAWAWLRNYSRNWSVLGGLAVYLSALFLVFAAYIGALGTDNSGILASLISVVASLMLMRGLFVQHRMGRQVMARANISPLRDVLTGLLNRDGLQAHLYNKVRSRFQNENTGAIFIYINVMDAEQAMQEHGEQGFEMGMVQIAASLSTSIAGVDGAGRISRHAFGITVLMPPDPALAIRLAQKILSRLMALASHGTPLGGTARMAMAWLPLFGFRLDSLERRCLRTLDELDSAKRIGWVGGPESHTEAVQMMRDARMAYSTPSGMQPLQADEEVKKDGASSNLYERIHRIEREMLHGVSTRFLVAEADRMSRELNKSQTSQSSTQAPEDSQRTAQNDYAPTELLQNPQKPWPG